MKLKVYNTESTSKYLEKISKGKFTVKEYRKNKTSIIFCNNCKKEFKYRFCDFIRRYNNGDIPHNCNKIIKVTKDIFENKLKEQDDIEKDEYIFLEDFIDYNTKILCKHKCGYEWKVAPRHFVGSMKTRCPNCSRKIKSKYELLIKKYLENNNYNFIHNYNPNGIGRRTFDFALVDDNNQVYALIEFDGEQHNKLKFNMSEENLLKQKENDKIKNEYAKINNIPLKRINYKDKNNYKTILENFLTKINGSTTIETK